jgi:hypothetical protein
MIPEELVLSTLYPWQYKTIEPVKVKASCGNHNVQPHEQLKDSIQIKYSRIRRLQIIPGHLHTTVAQKGSHSHSF